VVWIRRDLEIRIFRVSRVWITHWWLKEDYFTSSFQEIISRNHFKKSFQERKWPRLLHHFRMDDIG
jgi:hypothetical protein